MSSTPMQVHELQHCVNSILSLAYHPSGSYFAAGSLDGTARICNSVSGRLIHTLGHRDGVKSVAFSPDGIQLATGGYDNTNKIWDVASGELLYLREGHTDWVWCVKYSLDGLFLFSASGDNIYVWDAESYKLFHTLVVNSKTAIRCIACNPNQSEISFAAGAEIVKWKILSEVVISLFSVHTGYITSLAYNFDGSLLASASNDNTIHIGNPATGKTVWILKGHEDRVNCVTFSPNGEYLISGSDDKTIRIWSVSTGRIVEILLGHSNWVMSLECAPYLNQIVSGSVDRTIRLWDGFFPS